MYKKGSTEQNEENVLQSEDDEDLDWDSIMENFAILAAMKPVNGDTILMTPYLSSSYGILDRQMCIRKRPS